MSIKRNLFLLIWAVVFGGMFGCAMGTPVTSEPLPLPTLTTTETPLTTETVVPAFDGERAYEDVKFQVALGPRIPGTEGHAAVIEWMVQELESAGWEATVQKGEYLGHPIRNVVAKRAGTMPGAEWIILGAHFDTRSRADHDPDPARQNDPVPGANDGASGVAVLMELARVLPAELDKNVWLVFFDAEDDGQIEGREWIMGSSYFVEQLEVTGTLPDAAVIVDMIGDANLDIYLELNSDEALSNEIWGIAGKLGYDDNVIPAPRHRMIDDHLPFRNAGVPVVLMIDFDYPYWHTVEDTVDKVSGQSLKIVGATLLQWLIQR